MAETRLSTISQFAEITSLTDDDVLLVSQKAGKQYVSKQAKISALPFVPYD